MQTQITNLIPTKDFHIPDREIQGTDAYQKKITEQPLVDALNRDWSDGESLFSQVKNKLIRHKNFYTGEISEQWAQQPEGDFRLVFNLGATIIDLFTYLLSNNPPFVQIAANSPDKVAQARADFIEDQARKILADARFPIRFRDAVKTQFMLGFTWVYEFWNKDRKDGGENGTYDLSVLNPFNTRVVYANDDGEKVLRFITYRRVHPLELKKLYDFDAIPDRESNFVPKDYQLANDDKTTLFCRFTETDYYYVANGQVVAGPYKHGFKSAPLKQVNNIKVPDDTFGHSEIPRWQAICQEINVLLTSASEIARDLGYPTILEYNNALGGRKIPKWRGQKIPAKRAPDGKESIAYLVNPAQIAPIIKQAQFLIELLHFVANMPKSASGIFDSNITSGFQAKLSMQPATLTTNNRKWDWEFVLKDMVKDAFDILKVKDPNALRIPLSDTKSYEVDDLSLHEINIIWPDNLPVDIAREVQNLVLGLQNNLTSLVQATDRYNAIMGMGSPSDTFQHLKEEATDPTLNPDRALKVAKVKSELARLSQTINQTAKKVNQLRDAIPGNSTQLPPNLQDAANQANPQNLLAGVGSTPPEQQTPYPTETANEALNPNSTGGVVPPPNPMGGGQ